MKRYGPLAILLAAVPLLAFGPAERTAPTHWALIIGISDYIHFEDVEGGDLPGAEHDAAVVRDVLQSRFGFPESNVRMILNRDATRAAIEEGVTGWLAGNARPGDNVVVFYAGHGSQMWDENGDEDDGLDETLAPADVTAESTANDISDDTFGEWLANLPTDNVVVLLDNCNSGTGTRDVTPFSRSRRLGRDVNDVPRPQAVARRALPGMEDETGFDAGGARVLELAAAQPNQAAVDAFFPGENGSEPFHGGAFTTYLVRQLWRAPADATYEEVFRAAHEALKRNRFQQDPHISEDVPLKSFSLFFVEGGLSGASDATLPVTAASGGTVELGGGLALGITRGSVFETADGARMLVESATQSKSTARVVAGDVQEGDAAKLTAYRYAVSPLLANVAGADSETAAALERALGDSPAVRLVEEENAFSHVIVRRRADGVRVVGSDGFIRHDDLEIGDGETLASILVKEAAAKHLADMENPAQPFDVRISLKGDQTAFGIGDEISFHAESERAGYLTLVDLGTDGTVAVLLPNAEHPEARIAAGEKVTYPAATAGFQFQALPPAGRGLVRAFVTAEPLGLTIPRGETYLRGGAELARSIGEAVRSVAGSQDGAVRLDSWGTASLVYDIHN